MNPTDIYTDGGVVLRNPSPVGGTWAYVMLSGDTVVREDSGAVRPSDLGADAVTNQHTEMLAVLMALRVVGWDWTGTLHTDSEVTLRRIVHRAGLAGLPDWMCHEVLAMRRARKFDVRQLAGHPTKKELAAGRHSRSKLPVSRHNVRCDELCCAAKGHLTGGVS